MRKPIGLYGRESTRWLRFAIALVVGLFMLFWFYTLLLGVLVLILCFLYLVSPGILRKGLHYNFQRHRYLHQPLKYGVSVERVWVQGEAINAKASWSLLVTWQITRGWLILTPSGIPQIYLPISEMKKTGVYDQIMDSRKRTEKSSSEGIVEPSMLQISTRVRGNQRDFIVTSSPVTGRQ